MEKSRYGVRIFAENLLKVIVKFKAYIVLIILCVFLVLVGYEYYSRYFDILRNPESIKNFIMSYGAYSFVIFILLQILQVVAFFIPGELVQIAGGYIYGTMLGGIISLLGITLGSAMAYTVANVYGKPFVKRFVSEKNFKFIERILELGSKRFVVFLIYVIPGIPKDVVAYICGISNITFKEFMVFSTLGRIPCIFLSSFFGSQLIVGNKLILIIITIIVSLIFVIGLFKGEKIIKGLVKK